MTQTSGSSSSAPSSSPQQLEAARELAELVARYNEKHGTNLNPTLNELIYIVARLTDSVRQDSKYVGGWHDLVREVRRRLYPHLNSGQGYREQIEKLESR